MYRTLLAPSLRCEYGVRIASCGQTEGDTIIIYRNRSTMITNTPLLPCIQGTVHFLAIKIIYNFDQSSYKK